MVEIILHQVHTPLVVVAVLVLLVAREVVLQMVLVVQV
jgi:hypothetical protein